MNKSPWCPNCVSFGIECDVDEQNYDKPCDYYKPREKQSRGEKLDALHDSIVSGTYRSNQESNVEYSEDYDWGSHDFDNDPDWR